jgi:transposase-like protein
MSGHQILTLRKPYRRLPSWAATNEGIRKVLVTAFPNWETDDAQRWLAGRWARAIQLYFRANKSCKETAHEMREKPATIRVLVRQISRVARGSSKGPISPRNNRRGQEPLTGAQRVARLRRRRFLARMLERMETISERPELPEDVRVELEGYTETVQQVKEALDAGRDVSRISPVQDRALARKIDLIYRWYILT